MWNVGELIRDHGFLDDLRESLDLRRPPPVLRCAKIKITSRCNLRCVMCKYWRTTQEDTLSSDRWREVFAELADLGCRKVHFSGGEAFLRPDFLDLVEDATRRGLRVNMTTNGTLVDRDRARRIVDVGVNSVSISLDGPKTSVHDRIRGREGAFRKSVRTIRRLVAAKDGPRVRINFVVMRTNFRKLPAMIRLAGELGVEDLVAMPVDEKGERRNRLSEARIREYNRDVAPEVLALRRRYGFPVHPLDVHPFGVTPEEIRYSAEGLYARGMFERRTCLVPWFHTFIAWNGEVSLCCMTNGRMESVGNVGTAPVRDVFHGEGYRKIRQAFRAGRHLGSCHRCDLFLRENALLHAALDQPREVRGPVLETQTVAASAPEQIA